MPPSDPQSNRHPSRSKQRVFSLHHVARLAGQPGGRKLYQSIQKDIYWTALTEDGYATVRRYPICAKKRFLLCENVRRLQLFSAAVPLESVAIDVLGKLIKTARGNQYVLIISNRFTKLTKSIPLKSVSDFKAAKTFVHKWVFN